MKVYKFGGASVKDAESIRNVAQVLQKVGYSDVCMIISAMGKTTNALEEVVALYVEQVDYQTKINEIKEQHLQVVQDLFDQPKRTTQAVENLFSDLEAFLRRNKSPNYNYIYDQVVCKGELVSTTIVSEYLNTVGIHNAWYDVREYIKTDDTYREGQVDWEKTQKAIATLPKDRMIITQGFLGSDANFFTTTLGREGSDYSAAIFAYCLDAESMTIWKDVPGVLNADPRYFEDTVLLDRISYEEAIELAYYGASVIHPKTMQPLQNKNIPFFVKSFYEPLAPGTSVGQGQKISPKTACYILKKDQHLLHISSKDFSFITEENLSAIFNALYDAKIKVNLMQNSAISLSLCVEDKYQHLNELLNQLNHDYKISHEKGVNLYTIRHYDDNSDQCLAGKEELLRQTFKETLQIVTKS
ncbi:MULTISPECIES: aspartate kinase [Weeksella]|uniref:aspartate kinase n=1 Tax=Weeksella TaxID=1013 RepID=UPI0008A13C57|nr:MULTISPECIES: aspartate kinase [Weeksella]MDK7374138.1 aspartate kinase [Weeksella virosa]MDK7674450.1 aspartate kinase [Weeksella virosa]OFM82816.1 aspartate kinase [Weeksella sp. HMSC059D05]